MAAMSFITRCPTCSTAFRVVPDQLKLANGWVRCGHCNEVFEAILHRQANDDNQALLPQSTSWNEDIYLTHKPVDPMAALAGVDGPVADDVPTPLPAASPSAPPRSAAPAAQTLVADDDPWQLPVTSPAQTSASVAPTPPDETPVQELTFVRSALERQEAPLWQQGVSMVGVGVLGAAALLQALSFVVGHAQVPVLTPLVKGWCTVVPCGQVDYRLVESVLIESTALIRQEAPGAYRYEMMVVNQSEHMMTPPALELTLIDANDGVLVKKVLGAAEWMPAPGAIRPRSHVQAQLALNLSAKDAAEMSGYRAVLFYP